MDALRLSSDGDQRTSLEPLEAAPQIAPAPWDVSPEERSPYLNEDPSAASNKLVLDSLAVNEPASLPRRRPSTAEVTEYRICGERFSDPIFE
jgi:hypothetical protein